MRVGPTIRCRQRGLATVEFAIIGAAFFVVLFGVIEMSRALFVVNSLTEATRRGARMAAVCPVGDPQPANVAVFGNGGGRSALIAGLTTGNIQIKYLDAGGNALPNPTVTFGLIHFVQAKIVGFTLPLAIPFLAPTLSLSGFGTTIPRESLGVPRAGAIAPC